jgi:hypothetical protein
MVSRSLITSGSVSATGLTRRSFVGGFLALATGCGSRPGSLSTDRRGIDTGAIDSGRGGTFTPHDTDSAPIRFDFSKSRVASNALARPAGFTPNGGSLVSSRWQGNAGQKDLNGILSVRDNDFAGANEEVLNQAGLYLNGRALRQGTDHLVLGTTLREKPGIFYFSDDGAIRKVEIPLGNYASGLLSIGGKIFVTSSQYNPITQSFDASSLVAFMQNGEVQAVELAGSNPNGTVFVSGVLIGTTRRDVVVVLSSGDSKNPKPFLSLLDPDTLTELSSPIALTSSRQDWIAQSHDTITVDHRTKTVFIGSSDGSGRIVSVNLETGDVRTGKLSSSAFHSALQFVERGIFPRDTLFVVGYDDKILNAVDPEKLEAFDSLSFGTLPGPAVTMANGELRVGVEDGGYDIFPV